MLSQILLVVAKIVRPPSFRVSSLLSASLCFMLPRPSFVFGLTFVISEWHKLNHVLKDREISSPFSC